MDMNDEKRKAEEAKKTAYLENVRTEYREVCQNHRGVTDFRGKLLTLLPLASGAGIYLLIPKEGLLIPKQGSADALASASLIAIGLFGVLVALGLFLHELRGIEECGDLIRIGRALEKEMGLPDGQFIREDEYYHRQPTQLKCFRNNFKGPVGAAWIIYPSVGAAWLFVAVLGLVRFLRA